MLTLGGGGRSTLKSDREKRGVVGKAFYNPVSEPSPEQDGVLLNQVKRDRCSEGPCKISYVNLSQSRTGYYTIR